MSKFEAGSVIIIGKVEVKGSVTIMSKVEVGSVKILRENEGPKPS
jgi:hypothetical protein